MSWKYDDLISKAKVCASRADDGDGSVGEFWYLVALEMISRAVLSKISPALLAHPSADANLYYAFDIKLPNKKPKSIHNKDVFKRCSHLVPDFTTAEAEVCENLMSFRNEEMHTGGLPFENLESTSWKYDYFRICSMLLTHLDMKLENIFTSKIAGFGEELIKDNNKKIKTEVDKLIKDVKKAFKKVKGPEKIALKEQAKISFKRATLYSGDFLEVECPACGNDNSCIVRGEVAKVIDTVTTYEEVATEKEIIPTKFNCYLCGLAVDSYPKLYAMGLGDHFRVEEEVPATEYFDLGEENEDYSPDEMYYNND